jgi:ABC-type antimicrobial peptide transport system permease subunit
MHGISQGIRVKIPDKADLKIVESKLDKVLAEHRAVINNDGTLKVHLDPVSQMHFMPGLKDDEPTMSILNVRSILAISIVLIVVAIFNFMIIIGLSWKKRADEFLFRRAVGGQLDLFHQ